MAQTKATATDTTELTISPEALAAMAKALSEATLSATRRENDNPEPMNALGFPVKQVPELTYAKVYFCGAEQRSSHLTPTEAKLFNQISVPGMYGPDKTWEVRIANGVLHVIIHGINKREVRQELPRSLAEILRTIVDEQPVAA